MIDLTKEERELVVNVLSQLQVQASNPEGPKIMTMLRSIIQKLQGNPKKAQPK